MRRPIMASGSREAEGAGKAVCRNAMRPDDRPRGLKSMRSRIGALVLVVLLLLLVVNLAASCGSKNKTGTLVGLGLTMSLSDAMSGQASAAQFNGTVTVKLDDGTQVNATWNKTLGNQPTVGMKLEVAPTSGKPPWKVVRIVQTP